MPDSTPQQKDGEIGEVLQREVNASRKPAKVSIWEVEEEQTREVVDEMNPDAQISIQSQGQERAEVEQPELLTTRATCKPMEQRIS